MERRETPRMVPPEGRPREERVRAGFGLGPEAKRFARLVALPTERRLAFRRLGLAGLAGLLALAALAVVGSHLFEGTVRWLHDRPQYQTTFGAIALEPPPPACYRGGREAFLERVREASHRPAGPFSALDVDLDGLARDFRLYSWVRRVGRIGRSWPNRLVVHLDYRVPVAWSELPGRNVPVLLDAEGVILPFEDADAERNVNLISIKGVDHPLVRIVGLDPPFEPRPGHAWKSDKEPDGLAGAAERVRSAVTLAAFLNAKLDREARPIPRALQPVALHCQSESGLFVQNAENSMLYWPEAPGLRTAERHWADLRRWVAGRPDTAVRYPYYLDFTKEGVVVKKGLDPGDKAPTP